MAYTIETHDAFSIGEGEVGYDYKSVMDALEEVAKTANGRLYVDEEGNLVYESRLVRVE